MARRDSVLKRRPMVLASIAGAAVSASSIAGLKRHAAHLADTARASWQYKAFKQKEHEVVTEVVEANQLESLKLHQQGDMSLSTKANFTIRQKVRRNFLVIAQLSRWWDAALLMVRFGNPDAAELQLHHYIHIYKQISMELLDEDDYDEAEAEAEVMEEWPSTGEQHRMTRQELMQAVFEIADLCMCLQSSNPCLTHACQHALLKCRLWSHSIHKFVFNSRIADVLTLDAKDYEIFLRDLLQQIIDPLTGAIRGGRRSAATWAADLEDGRRQNASRPGQLEKTTSSAKGFDQVLSQQTKKKGSAEKATKPKSGKKSAAGLKPGSQTSKPPEPRAGLARSNTTPNLLNGAARGGGLPVMPAQSEACFNRASAGTGTDGGHSGGDGDEPWRHAGLGSWSMADADVDAGPGGSNFHQQQGGGPAGDASRLGAYEHMHMHGAPPGSPSHNLNPTARLDCGPTGAGAAAGSGYGLMQREATSSMMPADGADSARSGAPPRLARPTRPAERPMTPATMWKRVPIVQRPWTSPMSYTGVFQLASKDDEISSMLPRPTTSQGTISSNLDGHPTSQGLALVAPTPATPAPGPGPVAPSPGPLPAALAEARSASGARPLKLPSRPGTATGWASPFNESSLAKPKAPIAPLLRLSTPQHTVYSQQLKKPQAWSGLCGVLGAAPISREYHYQLISAAALAEAEPAASWASAHTAGGAGRGASTPSLLSTGKREASVNTVAFQIAHTHTSWAPEHPALRRPSSRARLGQQQQTWLHESAASAGAIRRARRAPNHERPQIASASIVARAEMGGVVRLAQAYQTPL